MSYSRSRSRSSRSSGRVRSYRAKRSGNTRRSYRGRSAGNTVRLVVQSVGPQPQLTGADLASGAVKVQTPSSRLRSVF